MNGMSDHVNSTPESLDMGGAPLHTDTDWTSRLWAMSKNGQFKTTRGCARSLSCNSLPVQKKLALQRRRDAPDGPLDPRLKIGRGKLYTDQRLCKRRNIAELRIKQPPTQLSPWRHATVSSLHTRATEEARADHVTPETKNWTHAENEAKTSILLKPTHASITN